MLLSGFPETALLEGLFVAVWGIARVLTLQRARVRFLLWLVAGAAGSLVIAAPALVAFVHFLDFGYTAYHGAGTGPTSYGQRQMSSLALPFAVGPVSHNPISGGQAGFLTLPAVLVGIIGFLGRRERPMRWLLSITLVLLLLNMYNFPPVNKAVQHVPGLQQILVYKYGFVLVEFIVILWAAYGVDDLRRRVVRRPVWIAAVVATFAYLVASVIYALALFDVTAVRWTVLSVTWTTLVCLAVAVLAYTRTSAPANPQSLQWPADAAVATAASAGKRSVWGGWGRGRGPGRGGWRRTGRAGIGVAVALAALVVVDAAGQFMVPQLGASPTHDVDLAPVRYLQQHQGTARFFSLGPIQPNYGSAFQLQQLNVNDLPVPQKMADLVKDNLHATWRTPLARGTSDVWGPYLLATRNYPPAKQRLILQVYGQRQSVYRSVGVAYLVMAPGVGDGLADRYGLTRVFKNRTAEIWHDPSAEPFFSTAPGSGCRVEGEGLDEVTVTCPRPTELTRRQLSSPGWTATINGVSSPIADFDTQRFQQVQLPAGTSTVTFSYLPRGFVAASVASLLLVGLFVVDALAAGVAFVRRRRHQRPHEVASGASFSGVSGETRE